MIAMITNTNVSMKWLSLLLAGSFLIGLAESQYTCNYSNELSIHKEGTTFMQQYVNQDEGTFTMRIRYTDGKSWIGIGINTKGKSDMVPAYAVIGDINRGVKRYDLQSDNKEGSGVIPLEDTNGHLKSASFVQTEAGESIMEFTHDLVIRDSDNPSIVVHEISESSTWIWAVGLPNNVWEGKHKVHGAFNGFELFNGCVKQQQTAVPTKAPTAPPTMKATEVTVQEDKIPDNEIPTKPENNASSDDTNKKPEKNDSSDDNDIKYPIDTEDYSPDNEIPIELIVDDTNPGMGETGGGDVSQTISFLDSGSSEATRALWVAHGILMGVAWGVFAPLAIGAAYLRNNLSFLKNNARWLQVHFYFSALVALFTIVGFALAVVATKKDDDLPHFEEDVHHKAGLAIFILVIIQAFAGYFRPSPIPKQPSSPDDNDQKDAASDTTSPASTPASSPTKSLIDGQSFDDGDVKGSNENNLSVTNTDPVLKVETIGNSSSSSNESSTPPSTSTTKAYIRKFWEYTHRLMGIIILSLAWYNCHSGIILQSENYDQDDEESLLNIFWGITGCIAGTIFFVGYVLRVPVSQ